MLSENGRQLGCIRSRVDCRTLELSDFTRPGVPPPPAARRWDANVPKFSLGGNNYLGNCTVVTAANELLLMRATDSHNPTPISDSAIIALSQEMGATNGYSILDRLRWWRKNGMWANRLWAYAKINHNDIGDLKAAVNACGVADIGVDLADAWRNADTWHSGTGRSYRPGSWGAHSVPIVGYDEQYAYVASWGDVVPFAWDAVPAYLFEAWALIDPEWIGPDGLTPSFLDLPALVDALRDVER